jgi:hypothetical protein
VDSVEAILTCLGSSKHSLLENSAGYSGVSVVPFLCFFMVSASARSATALRERGTQTVEFATLE